MQICGDNEYDQLGVSSTGKNIKGHPIVTPPANSHIDVTSIFSYSIYSDHSVWITHHGKAHAIGLNSGCRICPSSKTKFKKESKIKIKDENGNSYKFLSAVCGEHYTLYQITSDDFSESSKLAYIYKDENCHKPLFINLKGRHIISLYGGTYLCAAIESEGGVIILDKNLFKQEDTKIEPFFLPNNEKAVCMAFCGNMIIALSTNCKVFELSVLGDGTFTPFKEIKELVGKEIIGVNGTFAHCFAVSGNGKVYGRGSNEHGRLGMGPKLKTIEKFEEITPLKKHKIIAAYAGLTHSLFQTVEGKLLSCGTNAFGELMLSSGPSHDKQYYPVETSFTNVSYCIAGAAKSAVFVNCDPPPHNPNKRILTAKDQEILEMSHRIDHLQRRLCKQHEERKRDQEKIEKLEKQLDEVLKNKIEILDGPSLGSLSKLKKLGHSPISEVYQVNRENVYALKAIDVRVFSNKPKDESTFLHPKLKLLTLKPLKSKNNEDDSQSKTDSTMSANSDSESDYLENSQDNRQKGQFDGEIDHKKLTNYFNQIDKLNQLNHPNIIRVFAFSFGDENNGPSILLEFCESNLKHAVYHFTDEERIRVIFEISDALRCAHKSGIIHGDLNLKNVLLDDDKHAKVTDFGHSLFPFDPPKRDQLPFSRRFMFMAPELLNGEPNYSEKVDVYSFGVIVYVILMKGKFPKISLNDYQSGKKAPIPKTLSSFSQDLIQKCWESDPNDRPSFDEICELLKGNEQKLIE